MSLPARRRACFAALLAAFPIASCDCGPELSGLPEPGIEVLDEAGESTRTADPWLVVGFGDADTGQELVRTLTVKSAGTGQLTVTNTCVVNAATHDEALTAPCLQSTSTPFLFANINGSYDAGATVDLPVTFKPRQGGPVELFLVIASDAKDHAKEAVQLTGRGTDGRLCADHPVLDFGEVFLGDTPSLSVTLTNCGVRPVTLDTFALSANPDAVFSVTVAGAAPAAPLGPFAEGEAVTLDVVFAPEQVKHYRDALAGAVDLTTAAPYAAPYTLTFLGDGVAPPACRVNVVPQTVQFGAVASNATATQQLAIQSVGECACTVTSVSAPLPAEAGFVLVNPPTAPVLLRGTRGCAADAPEAATAENLLLVEVSYTSPDRPAPVADHATLDVTSTDLVNPIRTVNLEANGGGAPFCQLTVTPVASGGQFSFPTPGRWGTVEFGRSSVHIEKRLPITLVNVGNTACVISSVAFSKEENTLANEFSLETDTGGPAALGNVNRSINPGESAVYVVLFKPTHLVTASGIFPSFGGYSGSYSSDPQAQGFFCGLLSPNNKCNGVDFTTTDTVSDTSQSSAVPGVFSVGFSATPVEPDIDVIPGDIDFGLVTLGCGSPERNVNVYNTGSGDLVINQPGVDPSPTPADFVVTATSNPGDSPTDTTTGWPFTIPPGGTMSIRVRYYANSAAVHTGVLVIPTVEGGQAGPPATVPLRGEGTTDTSQVDIFDQFSDPKVDVLWVVDDSGSMAPEQQLLADNFPTFFTSSHVNNADYHIAVTTTLQVNETDISCATGGGACPDEPMAGYYTACSGNDRFLTPASADPAGQFDCDVRVSDTGNVHPSRTQSGIEGGFKAARKFLSAPNIDDPAINGGFLRDDAKLHVIMVSDEPDQSEGPVDLYVDFFRNLKGFRNDSLVAVSAIATDPGGCTLPDGTAVPDPGTRYPDLVDAMNGRFQSLCASDWTTTMSNLGLDSLGLQVEFFLSRAADAATLDVCVRNGSITATCTHANQTSDGAANGYFYDPNSNSIVFNPGSVPARSSRVEVHYTTYCF